jgi:hypothetical protein
MILDLKATITKAEIINAITNSTFGGRDLVPDKIVFLLNGMPVEVDGAIITLKERPTPPYGR